MEHKIVNAAYLQQKYMKHLHGKYERKYGEKFNIYLKIYSY